MAPYMNLFGQTCIAKRNDGKGKDESSKAEKNSAKKADEGSYKRIGMSLELNNDSLPTCMWVR